MEPTSAPRRTRVVVLFGGRSGEHGISVATAGGVLGAIDRTRYEVVPVGITQKGQWVIAADEPERWAITDGRAPQVPESAGEVVLPLTVGVSTLRVLEPGQVPSALADVDVVLPLLHGPYGEDGTLQGLLELADVRYVGSGVLASAVGMDKQFMKLVLAGQGLPIGEYTVIRPGDWDRRRADVLRAVEALGLPVFVKPARAGSSLGVTRVDSLDDLPAAVEEARRHDPKVMVEAGVEGREIECSVLGGRGGARARASLPGEIRVTDESKHGVYDYEAKYFDESKAELTCPADLPDHLVKEVQEVAVRTFEAVDAEGLARVDVFVTPDERVVVNEINTMPGFTRFSMYPRMWEASGVSYPELIDELVQLALERPTGLR
ncbi:D-alanine-D-alanine ligase [Promicromonospora thailandica]|uniref:D-alanine--D-alanine ligase n=2 Tax=Promicromonospora thailandica TaxID=765201 RepID=A0A9X2G279_9MICO|nr:D-alanine--D-alanine ligase family protein [Promicromonospora thailandica]MCP2264338.1 D-alanine-D-alanine ligase [Promicromonospora thailandica]